MVEIRDLAAGYGSKEIIHGVTLTVPKGELVSVIGPNGCGKTTLFRALTGLLPVTGGTVKYNGKPREEFIRKEFARLVSFLPQTRDIPAMTAEEFITYGRYPHLAFSGKLSADDKNAVREAMELTDTEKFGESRLSALSGGERQRVYIAMILAQTAEILFLDEPTTYLDVGQKFEIMELIRSVRDMGKTVVTVLHDLPLAFAYSDRIAVLDKGEIKKYGSPDEVFESGVTNDIFGVRTEKITVGGKTEYIFQSKVM